MERIVIHTYSLKSRWMVAENILPLFTEIEKNNLFCIYTQSNLYNTRSRHLQKKAIQSRFNWHLETPLFAGHFVLFGLRFRQLLRHCLKHQDPRVSIYILNANYYCCCLQYDVLEVDQFTHKLEPFPLLTSPTDYFPDTQDLTIDTEAREYWLQCFEDALDKVRQTLNCLESM